MLIGAPAGAAHAATPSQAAAKSASLRLAAANVVRVATPKAAPKHKKKPVHKKPAHKKAPKKHKLAFGVRVVRDASVYKGARYQWGASGPSRFDCSGFTRYIFAKFGIGLPHSSAGQYSMVRHISSSKKQIGDLIFFHSSGGHVYHVGIYAGNNRIWAATHTGDFVRLEGMWNASYYVGRIGH